MATVFWNRKGVLLVEFMQQGTITASEVYRKALKTVLDCSEQKAWNADTRCSAPPWPHDHTHPHTVAYTQALPEHFNWKLFDTFLTALILLWVTTTCLPTWRTGWHHSASTIMRSWWKVSKHGWAHRWQTSMTQTYKNLFPDTTSASILMVTILRSSLSMYFLYTITLFFSLLVMLTAQWRLFSE
jgi:hypothetical protein